MDLTKALSWATVGLALMWPRNVENTFHSLLANWGSQRAHITFGERAGLFMPAYRPLLERFVEKFELDTATGCWNWTGHVSKKGYSKFRDGNCHEGHRVSYELFVGKVPFGLEVDHMCKNRRCVNPNHLRAVTHKENCDHDRNKTHCPHGHEYKEGSYYLYKNAYGGPSRCCIACAKRRSMEAYRRLVAARIARGEVFKPRPRRVKVCN